MQGSGTTRPDGPGRPHERDGNVVPRWMIVATYRLLCVEQNPA